MKDAMTVHRNVGLSVAFFVFAAAAAQAQQFMPTGRDTLRGLPGVEVLVEPLAPEIAGDGLTAPAIQANVERVLRSSGIPIYATQAENPSPAKAYLYVNLSGFAVPRQGHVLYVQVHLRQTLRSVVTGSNIVNAMSWDQQTVLLVPSGRSMRSVHAEVESLVDRFVQDWQRVH